MYVELKRVSGCKKRIFHHSSSVDGRNNLAFPSAKVEVIGLEVAVAGLYLLEQAAFGAFLVAEDFVGTDIIGKNGEEKTVPAVLAEEVTEAAEVGAKKRVGLYCREVTGKMFGGENVVSPTNIRVVLSDVVPAFIILDDTHGSLERGQTQNGVLCLGLRVAQNEKKRYYGSAENRDYFSLSDIHLVFNVILYRKMSHRLKWQ